MLVHHASTQTLFDDLMEISKPITKQKEHILREKASFVNSIADDAFVQAYLGREMQEKYAQRVFKYIVHKFQLWVSEILLRRGEKQDLQESLDFSVRDYFGVMFEEEDCASGEFELSEMSGGGEAHANEI